MNKTYRSIWNASLGCYVAAPESAVAHSAGTSRARSERRVAPMQASSAMVMEQRIVFDGAMLATVIDAGSTAPSDALPTDAPATDAHETTAALVDAPPAATEPATDVAQADTGVTADTSTDHLTSSETNTADATTADSATADTTDHTTDSVTPITTEPVTTTGQEIVFVDGRVSDPSGFEGSGREVIVLNLNEDGLSQIAAALSGRSDIDAIHIVSHGDVGQLTLGSTEVTAESIQSTQQTALQQIGQALSADGDILIYACDYAAGDAGLEAMHLIADITGADVAASTDVTGSEALGGDWTLEAATGGIEAAALAPDNWDHALDFTFTPASSTGAMGMAQSIMGDGITVVSATYQGGDSQAGTFSSGAGVTFGSNVLSFTSGALLSTSNNAALVAGPNANPDVSEDATGGVDNDPTLNTLAGGYQTYDAAILDITFVPDVPPGAQVGDTVRMTIEVVFGSEEYLEYVNGGYSDAVAVIVNGVNQALVPNASGGESAISIDSVNNVQNQSLFVDNTSGTYSTEMDGFTRTIPLVFDVVVGQNNTLRLAVADTADANYDSWMFVRADSAQTVVVAENDSVTTAANLPVTVDLTANDYNLSGADMTLTKIQGQTVTQGQVITLGSGVQITVGAGGDITVTGDGTNAAHDTFSYEVSNGLGGVASATVDVNITAPNLYPPTARNDAETVLANSTHSDSVLVDNGFGADTDANGDPLSVVQIDLTEYTAGSPITLASGALLTMNANGSYVYNPNGAFDSLAEGATGTDSFSYTITDGHGGNSTATVTITVQGVNDAPMAADDAVTVGENGATLLSGLLGNDSDPDGDALGLVPDTTTGSNGGTISTDDSGNLYFDPGAAFDDLAPGQSRTTSFSYTLYDDHGASDTATVTVTVQGANDAPVGVDDHFTVSEEGAYLFDVLGNDTDPDSTWLSMSLDHFDGSNGGRFEMDDSGHLVFVPGSDFDDLNVGQSRQTSISYLVSDDLGALSSATAFVTVQGANDAPVAHGDSFTTLEDNPVVLGSLTVNDTDVDSDVSLLTVGQGMFAGDNGGRFYFDDGGSLVFDPQGDFDSLTSGESRFTHFDYTVYDDQGASSRATVTVEVLGVNDAPVAQDDHFNATEDAPIVLGSLTANDSDVDGNNLWAEVVAGGGSHGGRFVIDDGGIVSFECSGDFDDLQAGQTRDTSMNYVVYDNEVGSSQGVITVTVTGVNDNPVAHDDQFETGNHTAVSLGGVTGNDTDVEGDELSVAPGAAGRGTTGGQFNVDGSGSLIFDPAGDFDDLAIDATRETSYTYTLSDGHGGTASATVTVTVRGEAAPVVSDLAVTEPPPSYPNEVVFVDGRIPDPQAFALQGRELIVLNLQDNGLDQIAVALAGRSGIEAVHIVSHGGNGYLTLGSGDIDLNNLQGTDQADVQAIGQALSANGDILIYACDFASGPQGQNAMALLAQYSVADVSASLNTTGDASLNGDWVLEATVGTVEAHVLAPVGWMYTLNRPAEQPVEQTVTVSAATPSVVEAFAAHTDVTAPATSTQPLTPVSSQPLVLAEPEVRGFEALGAVRVSALETVFRQSITPFLATAADLPSPSRADGSVQLLWAAPAITIEDTVHHDDEAVAWKPVLERLDDSLVDEQLAQRLGNSEQTEDTADAVDALLLPTKVHAAPGFAAQLAHWNRWSSQRPVTRASARA